MIYRTCTSASRFFNSIPRLFGLCACLLIQGITPCVAQSIWQATADSARSYLDAGNVAGAYDVGLRGAIMSKPVNQADSVWSAIIQVSHRLPDSVVVSTLLQAGKYYYRQNEIERAETYVAKAIDAGEEHHMPQHYLSGYILMAQIDLLRNKRDNAARLYRRVLTDPTNKQCSSCRIDALLGLADTYFTSRQFDSAAYSARQALTGIEQLPDYTKTHYYPIVRLQLARCAYLTGDLTKALQEIEESYTVARANMPVSPYLIGIGYFYTQIVSDINDEKALEATQTALRVLQQQPNYSRHPYYLLLLSNEIGMLRTLDRTKDAALLADSVLRRSSYDELGQLRGFPSFLAQVNRTYIDAKRTDALDRIAQEAQKLLETTAKNRIDSSYMYNILGRYFQYKKNYREAARCVKEELRLDSIGEEIGYLNHSMKNRLAICQAKAGQRADAYASFRRLVVEFDENVRYNLWLMSDSERDNFLRTSVINGIFPHLLNQSAPTVDEIGLAYNYKLAKQGVRLKISRTINRFMSSRALDDSSAATIRQLVTTRARLADRISRKKGAEYRQLQQTADSLERLIGYKATAINKTLKPVRWQDIRAKLKPGEAVVEMVWYDNYSMNGQLPDSTRYSAFLLRPEWASPKIIHLPVPDEDNKEATAAEIAYSRTSEYYLNDIYSAKNQKEVFEKFWQPIASALGPVKRIYIALDGSYQKISLPTLRNPRTGKYLIDELDIVVVNSTQALLEPPRVSTNHTAELVGYPAYSLTSKSAPGQLTASRANRRVQMRNGLTFDELPYSKIEIEQLAKLLKTFQVKPHVQLDTAASEAAFQQMQSPKIVHVATHGYLRDSSRNASSELLTCGLVLAGAADTVLLRNHTDGILTGYEASQLNLHDTELVVLSACETGRGDFFEGEGVHGLQRAFLLAGAQSVLMSLWKVNDQLTQQLMTDFYRYWLSGLSKPQALRKAQLNLRKQYPEPYYWGAFVLLGQ